MLLSIIIPVYNDRDGLNYLLASIGKQVNLRHYDFEIIVVDDGSSVSYDDIIATHFLPIVFLQQKNGRQGKARNNGVNHAKGDYLWFIDADDDIPLSTFSDLFEIIADNRDLEILFFNAKYEDDLLRSSSKYCSKDELIEGLCRNIYTVAPWNKIYKKAFLETHNIQYPVELKYEDLYFSILTVSKAKKMQYFDFNIYNYYRNVGSTTNKHDKSLIDIFFVINKLLCEIKTEKNYNTIKNDLLLIHGIKYTIIRIVESKNLSLAMYVLSNMHFKNALCAIKCENLTFKESFFIKPLKLLCDFVTIFK